MRKMKKVAVLCLTTAMTMSLLAGCGGTKKDADGTSAETTEVTTEAESTEEEETTTEKATEEETEEPTTEALGVSDGDKVININFDDKDTDGFHTYTNGGNEEMTNEDGELHINIKKTGSVDYANQIYYDGFRLYQGCVYEYSFDVRCDIERTIEWRLQINGGDYHAYTSDVITIGPEAQHITAQFTMEEDSDPAPRLCFNMGKQEGMTGDEAEHNIYFDNILLEAVDASGAQQVEATPDPMAINVNQVGYMTGDSKVATVIGKNAKSFEVIDVTSNKSVYSADLPEEATYDPPSEMFCKQADFSSVKDAGTYKIKTDDGEESAEFKIGDDIYGDLYKDVVLMLYNQRCGVELDSSIAGEFAHPACHTGEAVVYGTDKKIDVTGGWHDAGDYGRYVVSGAKTVQDLFMTYEDNGYKADDIGIPESGNGVPDILDEARYELDWMLKMQDDNGGVYHKVTCGVFPETVMPEEETAQLIACPISNTATGDFVAVMAKASVLYKEYDADFAAKCLDASKKAYEYLSGNMDAYGFSNPEDIVTGEYPDTIFRDEAIWAAVELYAATGDDTYKKVADAIIEGDDIVNYGLGWADVGYYALYDYIKYDGGSAKANELFFNEVDKTIEQIKDNGFGVWVSPTKTFAWGSNMNIANKGMLLLMANKLKPDADYVKYASYQRDYLLGRNAVGYCYVTGYGTRTPLHPHHRPSQVLDVAMPGMLVGGADSNLEDPYAKAVLLGKAPESRYADNAQSFSCNEITIYWNSPLIYLLSGLGNTK